jgi:hypothetical protein
MAMLRDPGYNLVCRYCRFLIGCRRVLGEFAKGSAGLPGQERPNSVESRRPPLTAMPQTLSSTGALKMAHRPHSDCAQSHIFLGVLLHISLLS